MITSAPASSFCRSRSFSRARSGDFGVTALATKKLVGRAMEFPLKSRPSFKPFSMLIKPTESTSHTAVAAG